ncbi:hypothetical protein BT96DRAFT_947824 [Gymnopus androsaceus JB14]|uniref:Uncharacterized protein n=1 Tax=Gymnopus androsaceus JB14 TaxID=1447944 RepID=A0A6A4GSE0_9AGAR|nr:hypothetical protein BT96DRAFT_947824 [Gymnopus androsaceus JB14]
MIIGFVALFGLLQRLCLLPDCSVMSSACVHSHLKSPGLSQSQGPGGKARLQFRKAQAPAHWAKAGAHRPKPSRHITTCMRQEQMDKEVAEATTTDFRTCSILWAQTLSPNPLSQLLVHALLLLPNWWPCWPTKGSTSILEPFSNGLSPEPSCVFAQQCSGLDNKHTLSIVPVVQPGDHICGGSLPLHSPSQSNAFPVPESSRTSILHGSYGSIMAPATGQSRVSSTSQTTHVSQTADHRSSTPSSVASIVSGRAGSHLLGPVGGHAGPLALPFPGSALSQWSMSGRNTSWDQYPMLHTPVTNLGTIALNPWATGNPNFQSNGSARHSIPQSVTAPSPDPGWHNRLQHASLHECLAGGAELCTTTTSQFTHMQAAHPGMAIDTEEDNGSDFRDPQFMVVPSIATPYTIETALNSAVICCLWKGWGEYIPMAYFASHFADRRIAGL